MRPRRYWIKCYCPKRQDNQRSLYGKGNKLVWCPQISAQQNTLYKQNAGWAPNTWKFVKITGGKGVDQIKLITNITSDTITIRGSWDTNATPDDTSTYLLIKAGCTNPQDDTWQKWTEFDANGDNKTDGDWLEHCTRDLK